MLSPQDNALLTQAGPGTPGGGVIRHYWIPVFISSELPGPDCPPLRVRLLGEDLIAFRDSSGHVGVLSDHCPHRGASLFFGRSEEEGLRCVYHGWKFDRSGACVDMPNEPPESNFKHKIRHTAYPCRERNGVVWTYMGDRSLSLSKGELPDLPEMEWNLVSTDQCYVSKRVQNCNWFQALEGAIDGSHSNFLHSALADHPGIGGAKNAQDPRRAADPAVQDRHPVFETLETDAGVLVTARRAAKGGYLWRVNHYLMPFYTTRPPRNQDQPASGHIWVPIDDEKTIVFQWTYHPTRALTESELDRMMHGVDGQDGFDPSLQNLLPPTSQPFGAWRPKQSRENDYSLDYEAQKSVRFSGIPGGWAQDAALQEAMGVIYNRSREHLGTSDLGIIAARRYFMKAARAYQESGAPPPSYNNPRAWSVRSAAAILPTDADWVEALKDRLMVRPGEAFTLV